MRINWDKSRPFRVFRAFRDSDKMKSGFQSLQQENMVNDKNFTHPRVYEGWKLFYKI